MVRQPTESAWKIVSGLCCSSEADSGNDSNVEEKLIKDALPEAGGKLSAEAETQQQFELSYASVKGTDWGRWWKAYVVLAGYYGFIFVLLLAITLQYSDGIHF